jgi:mannose-6-phosphate isomerase-like protein (cupin superfamily)
MAGYTIKNLNDVDDFAKDVDNVEARFARSHIDSEHLGVSLFRFGDGMRAPFGHRHKTQEEVYVVIGGSGRMKLDDEVVELKQWDVVRVAPEVVRGVEGGPDGIEFIAVGNDRPEGGDGEQIQDFWND